MLLRTRLLLAGLAAVTLSQCAAAQSHIQLIENTPCLYEYRIWSLTFRRPEPFPIPREFTATQCAAAAQLNDRIESERALAEQVLDLSKGSADLDERAIDCLREFRHWRKTASNPTEFADALQTFPPFRVHGEDICREAKSADERISQAALAKAAKEKAETVRRAQLQEKEESVRVQKEAGARAAREAQARLPPPSIGMSAAQAITGTNWGKPVARRSTTTKDGVVETWTFYDYKSLTIVNGKVTIISE